LLLDCALSNSITFEKSDEDQQVRVDNPVEDHDLEGRFNLHETDFFTSWITRDFSNGTFARNQDFKVKKKNSIFFYLFFLGKSKKFIRNL
jgi:hypothetical protein